MMIQDSRYLPKVREQYENYPYPYRDPEDEKFRFLSAEANDLNKLNFYLFEGKNTFENFRALVAGCGTGDAVIAMAEQLRDIKSAGVCALDMSEASLSIAKERAKIRGLENIRWVHESLLELPNIKNDIGEFDYINCSGVLHHLADPDQGLLALKSVLKENGGIGIMLYSKCGRTAVYQMQEIMRMINQGEENIQVQVENTKVVLQSLPVTNWFHLGDNFFIDHKEFGDIGIYDLFLHTQDRAYTILEIYDYVEKAGLHFVDHANWKTKYLLDPATFIKDTVLLEKIDKLDKRTREAIGEILIGGGYVKHGFYSSRQKVEKPSLENLDNVPFLVEFEDINMYKTISALIDKSQNSPVHIKDEHISFNFQPNKYTKYIFKYLTGNNSLTTIFNNIRKDVKDSNITDQVFLDDFRSVYERFRAVDRMYLKNKNVPRIKTSIEIQSLMSKNRLERNEAVGGFRVDSSKPR